MIVFETVNRSAQLEDDPLSCCHVRCCSWRTMISLVMANPSLNDRADS